MLSITNMCTPNSLGSTTRATRELPVVRHAKKLANQVFNCINYLRMGIDWFGVKYTIVYPRDDNLMGDNEMRPYLEVRKVLTI